MSTQPLHLQQPRRGRPASIPCNRLPRYGIGANGGGLVPEGRGSAHLSSPQPATDPEKINESLTHLLHSLNTKFMRSTLSSKTLFARIRRRPRSTPTA